MQEIVETSRSEAFSAPKFFDQLQEVDNQPDVPVSTVEHKDLKENTTDDDGMVESSEADNTIETSGLTDEQRSIIIGETGWSNEIIDAIGSCEEYGIYKDAGLEEAEIGSKKGLIRCDINWDKKYETGKYDENGDMVYETNYDRIEKGRAPLDENGKPIELHHIGQHADSPLAELTFEEHRCNGNDTILHDKTKETETHGEGNTWDKERQDFWKDRALYMLGENENVENN